MFLVVRIFFFVILDPAKPHSSIDTLMSIQTQHASLGQIYILTHSSQIVQRHNAPLHFFFGLFIDTSIM